MRRILMTCALFVAAFLLSFSQVHAQNSPLDLFGFGQPIFSTDGHLTGLAGAGIALTDPRLANPINPAGWSWLARTRLESELHFDYIQSSQSPYATANSQRVGFGGFSFATPLTDDYHTAFAIGFAPLTDASAQIDTTSAAETSSYRSFGGLSELFFGGAFRLLPGVGLGARLDVLFGNVSHQSQIQFTDPTISSGVYERDYALSGLRGTFGLTIVGDSISHALHWLTLGAVYSTPSKLNSLQRTVITPVSSILDTTVEAAGVGYFPGSLQLGLNIHFADRYSILGDMTLQNYSTAYLYSPVAIAGDPLLGPSTKYAIGIDRQVNLGSEFGVGGFWDRLGLRLGASYYVMPILPAGSGGVNAIAVSAGLGIPISYESLMDLSFTVGQRSPVNAGSTPKDLFFQIGASLSLSERWFVPSRVIE